MKIKTSIVFLISALLFLFSSCDSSTNPPPEEKPPGYQEDVPWPSLADSPWPMYHHDPQNTGRVNVAGPTGTFNWKMDSLFIHSGVTIDEEGNIYFWAFGSVRGLYSFTPNGDFRWSFKVEHISKNGNAAPIIASNGNIYTANSAVQKIFCLDKEGNLKWEIEGIRTMMNSLSIGKDGVIYVVSDLPSAKLIAISENGEILWDSGDELIFDNAPETITFSPDGKVIYVRGTGDGNLVAYDIVNKTVKWTLNFGDNYYSPSVDSQGNIYVVDYGPLGAEQNYLYCISESGEIKWKYQIGDDTNIIGCAIGKNGNIYFAGHGSGLYCLDYKGNLLWKNEEVNDIASRITVDVNENIFVINNQDELDEFNEFMSVRSDGTTAYLVTFENRQYTDLPLPVNNNSQIFLPIFYGFSIISYF